ncbi:MAG TPA: prepilin-type N-terminal cleavage/methylation domain-containing protein [Pseudomonas sp.]|uniref:prepilin-type N-terminal cleavage/methylation domain-containing protein n=1 Tax=Pseudomonas sp. TaxID=306 RepID=UPI002B4A33C5|nr:prepilin-type N-terminal cleavage/methylation domain-containing protein [Pseudomonas sp.]HKS13365.1 prepilin-type N-terminal cleavage/methylation domain-containing protein [Pseudomonas sp.]
MSPHGPRSAGFTLLEMLAALALLAVLLTVTLSSLAQINRSLTQMRDSESKRQAARSLLDEQRDLRLRPGLRRGVTEGGIRWTERISLMPGGEGRLPLLRVELQLDAPGTAPWVLSTLVVQTPSVEAAAP